MCYKQFLMHSSTLVRTIMSINLPCIKASEIWKDELILAIKLNIVGQRQPVSNVKSIQYKVYRTQNTLFLNNIRKVKNKPTPFAKIKILLTQLYIVNYLKSYEEKCRQFSQAALLISEQIKYIFYYYIYIYVWKLNQTVLELDFRAVKFLFFPRWDLNPHHWYTAAPFA